MNNFISNDFKLLIDLWATCGRLTAKKNEDFESTIRNGLRDLKNSKYLKLSLTNKASTRVSRNLKWIVNYCNVLVIEINRMAIKSHNIRQVPQFRKGAWTTQRRKHQK